MPPNMVTVDIREALRQALDEEMARDERVFLMGEEVAEYHGAYKVTKGLLEKWGKKRVIDTPISELGFAGLGIGAAMTGLRPVVEFMSWNFSFVGCDQIISNAAKMYYMSGGRFSVPIVFRGPNGASAQVSSQHSHAVEAFYANLPGLIVLAPATPYDAKGLLKSAIRSPNPVLFLESERDYHITGEIPTDPYLVPIGQARVVQEGTDLTLISYSHTLRTCLEAIKQLPFSIEVIDLRSIKPLDIATVVASVRKTHRAVVAEGGHAFAGIAAELSAQLMERAFEELDAPVARLSQRETPMPYSKVLEAESLPTVARIVEAITLTMQ